MTKQDYEDALEPVKEELAICLKLAGDIRPTLLAYGYLGTGVANPLTEKELLMMAIQLRANTLKK